MEQKIRLREIADYLKQIVSLANIDTHRIDKSKDKGVCLYYRKGFRPPYEVVGGSKNLGFNSIKLTLLVRWGRNSDTAEEKALQIHNILMGQNLAVLGGRQGYLQVVCDLPIWLGMDEKGIFEYAIEFDYFYEVNAV